jgi:hypothetical protein
MAMPMDNFWILCLAAGALLVRVGMANFGGQFRSPAAIRNTFVEVSTCTIVWSLIAPMMLSGPVLFVRGLMDGRIPAEHLMGSTERMAYLSMLLVGSGLISMVLGEDRLDRVILATIYYVFASVLMGNLAWYGPFAASGLVDLGGLAAIIVPSAMMCALLLFRRRSAVDSTGASTGTSTGTARDPEAVRTASLPGTMLILVGLIPHAMLSGFLHESYRDGCVENVILGAATSALVAAIYCSVRRGREVGDVTVSALLTGAIASLALGGMVSGLASALVGIASGVFVPIMMELSRNLRDRHVHAILIAFMVGGAWGLKSVAFVMPIGEASRASLFGVQATGALAGALAGSSAGALMLLYCAITARRSRP